jgi:hypothetical protein
MSHVALIEHELQPAQVWSKLVSKEGHFILVAETVFRQYLNYHCIGTNKTSFVTLPTHAL